ncbi:MAG TPA: hypothetical protein PKC87_02985 [Candidatus Absconditabacterales bacterium]|nr:hypothetical protein [Candidatus Absconditabacterales bacterium]
MHKNKYYIAWGVGLFGILFLGRINGAIGLIGSENNPANLLYRAVFITRIIGSIISRFKSGGMMYTLFMTAVIQFLIPFFALFVRPAKTTWGNAGVIGVLILNFFFVITFMVSALLFRKIHIYYKNKKTSDILS